MIAILGDTHLGRVLYQHDLTPYIRHMMWKFFDFCVEKKVTRAIHLGDMHDSPRPTLANEKVVVQWANEFERAGIHLDILTGNHDVTAHRDVSSALAVLKAMPYEFVSVIDRPRYIETSDTQDGLLFLPFPSPSLFKDNASYLDEVRKEFNKSKQGVMVFSHLNVDGAKLGSQDFVYRGADFYLPFPLAEHERVSVCVNGHIHKAQSIESIHMLGAAQRLNFGERDNRIYFGIIKKPGIYFVKDVSDQALKLIQLSLDLSGQNGKPLTTEQAIASIDMLEVEGAGVKLETLVDETTIAFIPDIEEAIYAAGAAFVAIGSPIRIEAQQAQRTIPVIVQNVTKAVSIYISAVVPDPEEKRILTNMFIQVRTEVESGGKL